jgi:hypothetical protein
VTTWVHDTPILGSWLALPRLHWRRAEKRDQALRAGARDQGVRGPLLARATLYAADEFDVQQAVDALQAAAIATRLVADIGQDRCQQIIAEAFLKVRQ